MAQYLIELGSGHGLPASAYVKKVTVLRTVPTPEYVKSLPPAFQKTKDPLPKMLDTPTLHNRPEITEYCIGTGARVVFRHLYNNYTYIKPSRRVK